MHLLVNENFWRLVPTVGTWGIVVVWAQGAMIQILLMVLLLTQIKLSKYGNLHLFINSKAISVDFPSHNRA
jgi:hypothetical protein